MQPVIHVSADGRSAKIRARLFQLGGPAGGEGSWISGIYENTSVDEEGTWKLSGMDLDYVWQAPSRGGWVRVKTPPTAPQVAMTKEFPPDRPLGAHVICRRLLGSPVRVVEERFLLIKPSANVPAPPSLSVITNWVQKVADAR